MFKPFVAAFYQVCGIDTAPEAMTPLLDEWIENGRVEPMIVVFPTYYPDQSFVTSVTARTIR